MVNDGKERNQKTMTQRTLAESLAAYADCYRGYAWELISMDLKAAAEEYFNQEKD